jgi:hypothetical protein
MSSIVLLSRLRILRRALDLAGRHHIPSGAWCRVNIGQKSTQNKQKDSIDKSNNLNNRACSADECLLIARHSVPTRAEQRIPQKMTLQ